MDVFKDASNPLMNNKIECDSKDLLSNIKSEEIDIEECKLEFDNLYEFDLCTIKTESCVEKEVSPTKTDVLICRETIKTENVDSNEGIQERKSDLEIRTNITHSLFDFPVSRNENRQRLQTIKMDSWEKRNVPPGLTTQQVQWLQQQANQQGIVLPPHIQQKNITPGILTQPTLTQNMQHAPGLSPINPNAAQFTDQNQQQQIQLRQFRLLQLQREQAQKTHLTQQQQQQQQPTQQQPPQQGPVQPSVVVIPQIVDSTTNISHVPDNNIQNPLVVNAKTKTALANMLNIKLQTGDSSVGVQRLDAIQEPSAAGTLRLMTAQHNAALNQKPQEIIVLQRRTISGLNGEVIKTPGATPPHPLTPTNEPPKLQYCPKPALPLQHRPGPFCGHNPNLKYFYTDNQSENNQNHTNLPTPPPITIITTINPPINTTPNIKHKDDITPQNQQKTTSYPPIKHEEDDDYNLTPYHPIYEDEDIDHPLTYEGHFLDDSTTIDDNDDENLGNNPPITPHTTKKTDLLEYLVKGDGTVTCKICGEVLATRTHWYRHKYKIHGGATTTTITGGLLNPIIKPISPAPLFKCRFCNVFYRSRQGYLGHVGARHGVTIVMAPNKKRRKSDKNGGGGGGDDGEKEKVEKFVADIIRRVKEECEKQGGNGGEMRRGYSRRATSIMNFV